MKLDIGTILSKTNTYKSILKNTEDYRKVWKDDMKKMIMDTLSYINKEADLGAEVILKDNIDNMEAIVLDLGRVHSGLSERIEDTDIKKTIIKTQGALVYQQLFNGKVMIMIIYPYIEGYGEPKPPKNLEILRPEELKQSFILRHVELLLKEITEWEDYDDDEPSKSVIGFNNHIGFTQVEDEIIEG